MFIINFFIVLFLIADGMMKTRSAQAKQPEEEPHQQVEQELPPYQQLVYADDLQYESYDYTKPFSFASSVMWSDLLILEGLVTTLMSWCFYFQTNRAI